MSRPVMFHLIVKDLYLYRHLIVIALVAGVVSLVIAGVSSGDNVNTGLNIGMLLFITTVITFGIFVPMAGILKERQDGSRLFVLSLPVSGAQYVYAKVTAALIAFLVPWFVLTAGTVVSIGLSGDPRGGIPFFVAMMVFFLMNFCILLAIVVITMSELWSVAAILLTNIGVTLFFAHVSGLPGVAGRSQEAAALWSPAILTVLAIEVAVIALSLGLAWTIPSRKRDLI